MPGLQRTRRRGRPRLRPRQPGLLVHFEPQAVAGAVPERLAQPCLLEHGAGGAIDHRRVDARPHGGDGGRLGGQDRGVQTASSSPGGPTETVRVRSEQYPSKTPPKSSTTRSPQLDARVAGAVVRQRRVGPRRDDGFEGGPLVARPRAAPPRSRRRRRAPRRPGRTAANAASATGVSARRPLAQAVRARTRPSPPAASSTSRSVGRSTIGRLARAGAAQRVVRGHA